MLIMAMAKRAIGKQIGVKSLEEMLPSICSRETSASPEGWTKQNPLYGHCAVVSLVAQNLFGGELLRTSLDGTKFSVMGSHYVNRINGKIKDFTAPQFEGDYPAGLQFEPRTRDYILYDPKTGEPRVTMDRYKQLAFNLAKYLNKSNSLFDDQIYKLCFDKALESRCKKMWFGSVIMHGNDVVYSGSNNPIEPLKEMCNPNCVRADIPSRTESMLGACSHAEELGIWEVAKKRIPLDECSLYVAGLNTNGLPWLKKEAEHTCLRCAVQMYNSGLGSIFVPVGDSWERVAPKDAVKQASAYATQVKKAMSDTLRSS